MKTILVPIDFSPITAAVVNEAAALAKAYNAWIMLVTVTTPPIVPNEYGVFPVDVTEIVEASAKTATRQLNAWKQKLKRRRIRCEGRQFTGSTVQVIVEEARTLRADYIVVGSHGHNAVYDLLVGSTTQGVLFKAPCPVLIVPAVRKAGKARKKKT
ncbi:MAG: UspA domain protein [Verrucomicrobia bacterium]|nr:UspA domain protein [Verrucomicrobiota bacterium]